MLNLLLCFFTNIHTKKSIWLLFINHQKWEYIFFFLFWENVNWYTLNYPIVIIRNVNVNMLLKALKSTMVEIFMNKYKYNFFECIIIYNTQLNHIWKNAQTKQCFYDITKENWIDHKHVYFTFKFPNFFPNSLYEKLLNLTNVEFYINFIT